jgi:hypothetical protein
MKTVLIEKLPLYSLIKPVTYILNQNPCMIFQMSGGRLWVDVHFGEGGSRCRAREPLGL